MFTYCVGKDEVGKVFSAVALIAALAPMITNPAFKGLYNATIDTFPAAFLLMAAAFYVVSTSLAFKLFWVRDELKIEEEPEETEMEDAKSEKKEEVNKAFEQDDESGKKNYLYPNLKDK